MSHTIDMDSLKNTARELNTVMGLEPPIKTDQVDREYLIDKLLEASKLLMPDDELSEATEKVLEYISEQS